MKSETNPLLARGQQSPRMSISFEQNLGQFEADARYVYRGRGYDLFLTSSEAVFNFVKTGHVESIGCQRPQAEISPAPMDGSTCVDSPRESLRLQLLTANSVADAEGRKPVASYSNYLIGNDPQNWRTHVPHFAEVWYPNVYRGVDLVYHGEHGQLEYDFIVAPHANAKAISFSIDASDRSRTLRINSDGDLVIPSGQTEVLFRKPRLYQGTSCLLSHSASHGTFDSCNIIPGGRFVLRKHDSRPEVAFELPPYDRNQTLVIDPVVGFSTFLGGGADDSANGMALDSSGNIYVIGTTDSPNFPVTPNALQKNLAGNGEAYNAFVTKLSADGSSLIFSTYLGGGGELAHGIAVDSSNNAYVTGETYSADFPLVKPYQTTNPSGSGFVSKLSPDGASLIFSTFLGGSLEGSSNSIAVDSSGEAVVSGRTYAVDFPVVNAFQPTHASDNGEGDAFVTKFSADGQSLVFSTYLGGNSNDMAQGVAVDSSGNVYLGGITYSSDFPVTTGAYQTTFNAADIESSFVSKFSATGALIYSTYLAASQTFGIAVNASGNAFVTGMAADQLPVTPGAFQTTPGGGSSPDAFVTEFDSTGSSLVYSTFLGGNNVDTGNAIAVDSSGDAYVTGQTSSLNFPLQFPLESTLVAGVPDAFVSELNSTGSQLLFSTYLGGGFSEGSGSQQGNAIAVDNTGNIYVSGTTNESDFPVEHALQPTLNGFANAFITELLNQPAPAIALNPASVSFPSLDVGSVSAPQTITLTNVGKGVLNTSAITISGGFGQTNDCTTGIAVGGTCAIQATFSPTTSGAAIGQISINSNATLFPETVQLSGNAQDFSIFGSPSAQTVSAGQSATVSLTLEPWSGFAQQITFSCSGNPTGSACVFSPASVTLDGVHTASVTTTVSTTANAADLPAGDLSASFRFVRLLVLLGICLSISPALRMRRTRLAFIVLVVLGLSLIGCGGGSGAGNGGGTNTPSGTYTVIIIAKSGSSLTHSLNFTLTVN